MAGLVNIGEMGSLALHILIELAKTRELDVQARLNVNDLARRLGGSVHTIHKVTGRLVKAGMLDSSRGAAGGLKLKMSPDALTLMQAIEAVDGKVNSNSCLFAKRVCLQDAECPFAGLATGIENRVLKYLLETTVADLLAARQPRSQKMKPQTNREK